MTRPSRRTIAIAVAVITGFIVALTATLAWPRETEPTAAPAATQADTAGATTAREAFTASFAPKQDVASTLMVPATDDWWKVVTGLAAPLGLHTAEPPAGAEWFAFTSAAPANDSVPLGSYTAVYIGFPSTDEAEQYRAPASCRCAKTTRVNVITLTDATTSPEQEAFRYLNSPDAKPLRFKPNAGSWSIDLTAAIKQMIGTDSRYATQQRAYFEAQGANLDKPMVWTATSATPRGPWTGKVDGVQFDNIDILDIGKAIGDTTRDTCKGTVCETVELGLLELTSFSYVSDGDLAFGDPTYVNPTWADTLGDDIVLAGAFPQAFYESRVRGLSAQFQSDLDRVYWTLSSDGTLTVEFALLGDPVTAPIETPEDGS